MPRLSRKSASDAANTIKLKAQRLFAQRGIDGVTVREIAQAAGQKNHSAVGYHFGSKEALVREIILDGAILIDNRRNAMLDEMEAAGGPKSVREIVELLIDTSLNLAENEAHEDSYLRFLQMLESTHEQFFIETLAGKWNSGYQRCLEHLRNLMPDMPLAAKNQRFVFMGTMFAGVLSMRERALTDSTRTHKTWESQRTLDHLALSMTAVLEAPLDKQLEKEFKKPL